MESQEVKIADGYLKRAEWLIGQQSGPLADNAGRVLEALAREAGVSVDELKEAVGARRQTCSAPSS